MLRHVFLALTTLLASCATGPVESSAPPQPEPDYGVDGTDWSIVGPLDLLERLRLGGGNCMYSIDERPPLSWIGEEDVAALMALVRSAEPACSVVTSLCSNLPVKWPDDGKPDRALSAAGGEDAFVLDCIPSTVGREAAFLIDGFRSPRGYPVVHSSIRYTYDPEEIERWWAGQNESRLGAGP